MGASTSLMSSSTTIKKPNTSGQFLPHLVGQSVLTNANDHKPTLNPTHGSILGMPLTPSHHITSNPSNKTISTPPPVQFTGPPPPQLFYWPYPSPPISPPNNFYTALQGGLNPLQSPILGQIPNGLQISRHSSSLGIVPFGNSMTLNPLVTTSAPTPCQNINGFICTPPLPSPEILKTMI